MSRSHLLAAMGAVASVLLVGACRIPGESPATRYWVLEPIEGRPADVAPNLFVGVGPFELPAYLQRQEIVARSSGGRLTVAPFDSWGEDIERGFAQTLGRNLEVLMPGVVAVVFPWKGPAQVDRRVAGVVRRFEVVDGASARLEVTWAVLRGPDNRRIARGSWRGEAAVAGSGTTAEVEALGRVLGDFSGEVAKVLRETESAAPPDGVAG